MRTEIAALALFCFLAVVPLAGADSAAAAWYEECRPLWSGIPIQVRFSPPDQALADEVWRYLESVDGVFNDWRDDSELGRIHLGGPGTYELSQDLAEGFAQAAHLHLLTEGAFDITVGPLRRLWRDAAARNAMPSAEALAAARAVLGSGVWAIAGRRLTVRRPGVKFDFGGFVKGLAVDRAMQLLITAGRRAALVQCGGETGCFGLSPRARTHVLGIPHPDRADDENWCVIADPGSGLCASTSGNYRQPVIIAGKPYYHIFDPRTGLPVDDRVLSVSVVFPLSARNGLADALTKVGAVLGHGHLLPLVESLGGQALVLMRDGDRIVEHASSGWSRLVQPPPAATGAAPSP